MPDQDLNVVLNRAVELLPSHAGHWTDCEAGQKLPFLVGEAGRKEVFYIIQSGSVIWLLEGQHDAVRVQAPAAVGHVDLVQSEEGICRPPCASECATVTERAKVMQIRTRTLTEAAEEANKYVELCNNLRLLACAGGWDPYLEVYRNAAPTPQQAGMFKKLLQPYEGHNRPRDLVMLGYQPTTGTRRRSNKWTAIIDQGEVPLGFLLVCNGYLRASVRLRKHAKPRIVTAYRAPSLVGEFERPLAPPDNAHSSRYALGAIAAGATIEVLPHPWSHHYTDAVYVLRMSYNEYVHCCDEDPSLAASVAGFVRQRTVEWLPRLGMARNYLLLVATLVLDEWKRAQDLGLHEARIPTEFFKSYLGGDDEQGRRRLRQLGKSGILGYELGSDGYGRYHRITNVKVEALDSIIASSGRLSHQKRTKTTPEVGLK